MARHSMRYKARWLLGSLAAAFVLSSVYQALAGARITPGLVTVNTTTRTASGYAGDARNSGDSNQYVFCGLSATATSISGYCAARNTAGTVGICATTNANLIAAVRHMAPDSYVSMAWDASSVCTQITIESGSKENPKGL